MGGYSNDILLVGDESAHPVVMQILLNTQLFGWRKFFTLSDSSGYQVRVLKISPDEKWLLAYLREPILDKVTLLVLDAATGASKNSKVPVV